MTGEIDLHGVLVTPLLFWMAVAYVIHAILHQVLSMARVYRLVWHPALFDCALYIVILGGVVAVTQTGFAL